MSSGRSLSICINGNGGLLLEGGDESTNTILSEECSTAESGSNSVVRFLVSFPAPVTIKARAGPNNGGVSAHSIKSEIGMISNSLSGSFWKRHSPPKQRAQTLWDSSTRKSSSQTNM